ncbi:MAG: peptide deformylase [Candidatus Omnitrophica bacterium]|nr:peptide deformylase [Candidatus Omnitrophota bacterium]MBU4303222.1 peptide deformylase [Candidatus Omnitrophota bacterium]MCG2708340.1 peptide deformylase [Candidatus Omnitrophota bacterium]
MPEIKLKIKVLGDSVLRKKAKLVGRITDEHRRVLSQMAKAMYDHSGIGLAAPQLGQSLQLIVVDIGEGLYKLVNPKIVKSHGRQSISEGCLSVPGVCIKVKRAKQVWVQAQDENSRFLEIAAKDLFACVLQHEIEHLKGKLIIDYASFLDKIRIKRKLALLKDKGKVCKLQL